MYHLVTWFSEDNVAVYAIGMRSFNQMLVMCNKAVDRGALSAIAYHEYDFVVATHAAHTTTEMADSRIDAGTKHIADSVERTAEVARGDDGDRMRAYLAPKFPLPAADEGDSRSPENQRLYERALRARHEHWLYELTLEQRTAICAGQGARCLR